ncbi:unnamed protein product [Bemisia tabaci]|uniref:Ionotropic receptor n=1 Tax=Bemisia tabaci TaxID=7038 RepID=A0A9P0EXM8_BEMTA|nr:unnamed protein product [Bemisia tabaci]
MFLFFGTFHVILVNPHQSEINLISTVSNICKNAARLSQQSSFYIVNAHTQIPVGQIAKRLHKNSIATTVYNHCWYIAELNHSFHPKNVLFLVKNVNRILDLILASSLRGANHQESADKISNADGNIISPFHANASKFNHNAEVQERITNSLPHFCIQIDPSLNFMNNSMRCDYDFFITYAELEHGSKLSDLVFNTTRNLFHDKLWNPKNHLIFVVSDSEGGENLPTMKIGDLRLSFGEKAKASKRKPISPMELQFFFKFFWRFFKGIKIIICLEENCFYYNPFAEHVLKYPIPNAEKIVDFVWNDWGGKGFTYELADDPTAERASMFYVWDDIFSTALEELLREKNCMLRPIPNAWVGFNYFEDGQKFGPDFFVWPRGLSPEFDDTDSSKFESTNTIEDCSLCIVTPRANFVPQPLVIFKCFDPSVWLCFLISVLLLLCMQYLFQHSQITIFGGLYTTTELFTYEETSVIITVWEYFMCGAPMRLLLGRLFTGKILFIIFSFAVLILSTVIQSRMFQLLSEYSRYAEIDTVQDLAESNVFIRVPNMTAYSHILAQHTQFGALKKKLVQDYNFYPTLELRQVTLNLAAEKYTGTTVNLDTPLSRGFDAVRKNEHFLMKMDAYLLSIPNLFLSQTNFLIKTIFAPEGVEFHRIEECFVKYPFSYSIPKNAFYFEPLNRKIVQLVESGWVKKFIEGTLQNKVWFGQLEFIVNPYGIESINQKKENQPRPFGMVDLQLAFISLGIGHFLSFLTFTVEIFVNYDETLIDRFFNRIKIFSTNSIEACISCFKRVYME